MHNAANDIEWPSAGKIGICKLFPSGHSMRSGNLVDDTMSDKHA